MSFTLKDAPSADATHDPLHEPPVDARAPKHRLLRFFASGKQRPLLDDSGRIDALYRSSRLSVMIAICLGYGFMYTCRLGMSVVKKPLIDGGIFNPDELGHIGSFLLWGYALGRLVNGFLADHANLRKFFTIGMLLTAGANLAMGSTTGLWLWAFLWGLNGWFQGFGAPSSIVSIAHWFRPDERGRAYGIWSLSHSLGEGLTVVGTAALVSLWGWRAGFIGPGVFCVFAAVFVWLFMRDRPQTLGLPAIGEWQTDGSCPQPVTSAKPSSEGQWQVLELPALWVLCLASAMMYMTRYAIMNWGILYLQEARGYTMMQAGSILGVNTAAGIAGCVAYGFMSDKLFGGRRPPVTLAFGIVEVLSLLVIFFTPPGHPLVLTAAFVVYGFTLSGLLAVLGGLFAMDIVPRRAVGAAIGLTGVFSYAAAGLQDRISGYLIHAGDQVESITDATGEIVKQVHHYDFSTPILFWIGSSVVSLLLATSLWRVRARD